MFVNIFYVTSFLKSAINQMGRDMGRAVSNQILKNAHSTPYRRTNYISSNNNYQINEKTEFEKNINFQNGLKPITLIEKISVAYIALKNEANYFISDGYLDMNESDRLFSMMQKFNDKIENICEILELNEIANKNELEQLVKISEKSKELFFKTLKVAEQGCIAKENELKLNFEKIESIDFFRFVGLHTIWMGKYATSGENHIFKTIIANLLSLPVFPILHIAAFLYGYYNYNIENSKRNNLKKSYIKMAEIEIDRAKLYKSILN